MIPLPKRARFQRRALLVMLLAALIVGVSGCRTLNFYQQAIRGQAQLIVHQTAVTKLLDAPQTPARLRAQLQLLQALRQFGQTNLSLPVDGHYRKYVDVHRPFVVWNVEAAPEFSMQPKGWWYPIVGRQDYRGYFSKQGATDYGSWLAKRGYDVYVGGVSAYSTLGWFSDPALSTFIFEPEADLAELIFHELGHQRLFVHGDTDFNEAFATTVGEEGARRWLEVRGSDEERRAYQAERQRNRQFVHLIMQARARLETLYGDERTPSGKWVSESHRQRPPTEDLRRRKAELLAGLQRDYAQLKAQWGGNQDYDEWFAHDVNNAKINSVATYYDLFPGFERLLADNGGDLEKFYAAAERLSLKPRSERHRWLRNPEPATRADAAAPTETAIRQP